MEEQDEYISIKALSERLHKDFSSIKRILEREGIQPVKQTKRGNLYRSDIEVKLMSFLENEQNNIKDKIKFSYIMKQCAISRSILERILKHLNIEIYKSNSNIAYCPKGTIKKVQEFLNTHKNTRQYFTQKTCLSRYGVRNIAQLDSTKKKVSETSKKNNKKEIRRKAALTYRNNIIQERAELERTYGKLYSYGEACIIADRNKSTLTSILMRLNIYDTLIKSKVSTHLYLTEQMMETLRKNCQTVDIRTTSFLEKEIADYIKSIYSGIIIENTHDIIKPRELDIYIPEKRVAIEFDGLLWHSTLKYQRINHRLPTKEEIAVCKNKHLDKTIECEKQGIRLIHIFEDEWLNKKDICKSIISSALGIYQKKIYARKCEIREIEQETYKNFLNSNHIQGYTKADYRYGLFYEGNLVQSMGISRSSHKQGEIELNRMATLTNTQVLGGFSRLLKHICGEYGLREICSYVSRRLFDGKGYKQVGFKTSIINKPTYFYTIREHRYPRYMFMRHKIEKKFNEGKLVYWNSSETEEINMYKNGYGRIWDCGTIKVTYNFN